VSEFLFPYSISCLDGDGLPYANLQEFDHDTDVPFIFTAMLAAPQPGIIRKRPIAKMENITDYRKACWDVRDSPGDHRPEPTNYYRNEVDPYTFNSIGPKHMMGSGEQHAGHNTGVGRERAKRFFREKKHPKQKVHVDQGRLMAWADWVYSTPNFKP